MENVNKKKLLNNLMKSELKGGWGNIFYYVSISIGLFEAITGSYLFFVKTMNQIDMMLLLAHIFLGLVLVFTPIIVLSRHLKYRKLIGNRFVDLAGFGIFVFSSLSILAGIFLLLKGVSGNRAIWLLHVYASGFWVLLQVFYFNYMIKFISNQRSNIAFKKNVSFRIFSVSKKVVVFCSIWGAVFIVSGLLYTKPEWYRKKSSDNRNAGDLSVTKLRNEIKAVNPKALLGSRSCGTVGCHEEITKQWEHSYHKYSANHYVVAALNDYKAEIESGELFKGMKGSHIHQVMLASRKRKVEALGLCMECHDPVPFLSKDLGSDKNLSVVLPSSGEGVSCMVCHSIKQVNHADADGKGQNKFSLLGPRYEIFDTGRYLFSNSNSEWGRYFYETLIYVKPESHRKSFNKIAYTESSYCVSCHRKGAHYDPWLNSAYSPKNNPGHPENVKNCQTCHMPQMKTSDDISAREKGTIADHRFLARGGAIPKFYGFDKQLEASEKYAKDKKVIIKIITPEKISTEKHFNFIVRVANVGIGHIFPGLPNVLAEAWLDIKIKDFSGKILYSYGDLDKEGYLDYKKTFVFGIRTFDRMGNRVRTDRHRPWRISRKESKSIKPKEFVDVSFSINLSTIKNLDKFQIEAKLNVREPNQQFSDWVLGRGKFKVPVFQLSKDAINVKLATSYKENIESQIEWKKMASEENFLDCKKSHSFNWVNPDIDLHDEFAIEMILNHINLLISSKKYEDALELIKELKDVYSGKELVKRKLAPIESQISSLRNKN